MFIVPFYRSIPFQSRDWCYHLGFAWNVFFYSCHPKCSIALGRGAYITHTLAMYTPQFLGIYILHRQSKITHQHNYKKKINAWNPLLALMYQDIGAIPGGMKILELSLDEWRYSSYPWMNENIIGVIPGWMKGGLVLSSGVLLNNFL